MRASRIVSIALLAFALATTARAQSVWHWVNSPTGRGFMDVIWTGTQFVAVGELGTCATSPDGETWTKQTTGTGYGLFTVGWNGKKLVAAGEFGIVMESPDGVTWTVADSAQINDLGPIFNINTIVWANDKWIMAGEKGHMYTSTDNRNWTEITNDATFDWNRIIWTGTQYVAVGVQNLKTSPDGATWTERTYGAGGKYLLDDVAVFGDQLVAVGGQGVALFSPDGATWTVKATYTTKELTTVFGAGDKLVAMGAEMVYEYTANQGKSWYVLNKDGGGAVAAAVVAQDKIVFVGDLPIGVAPIDAAGIRAPGLPGAGALRWRQAPGMLLVDAPASLGTGCSARLLDSRGRQRARSSASGSGSLALPIPGLERGVYVLEATGPGGSARRLLSLH